ncbi:MAG TPA: hypothetical protein GXZ95_01930 [Mollicutes bacterium]|nr:hypothetical protein [Mollicutes bacterium]
MFLGENITSFFNNWRRYYLSLADAEKLIIYIILILILILVILFIIMREQKRVTKKIASKKIKDIEDLEVMDLDLDNLDIDETNEKTRNLKEITEKIQSAIENRAINLTKFEEDQENNSVISYKELVKKIGKDVEPPKEEFSLSNQLHKNMVAEEIEEEQPYVNPPKEGKFKSSVFISPVFGIQDPKGGAIKTKEVEIKPQTEVSMKNQYDEEEAFLNNLIKFRKNLE